MKLKNVKEELNAKGILEQGKTEKFWELIVASLEESIEHIETQRDSEDMKELSPEMYKLTNELFKAKKEFLKTLIRTPDNIISWLEKPSTDRPEFDPYEKSNPN